MPARTRISIFALAAVLASGCLLTRAPLVSVDASAPMDVPLEEADAPPDSAALDVPACEGAMRLLCEGVCVEASSDDRNCGRCGVRCGSDMHCEAGDCVCDVSVYGTCDPGLRLWLDAQNTTGMGTAPEGALTTWANLASTTVGDAELESGSVVGVAGIEGNRAVRFGTGRMRTTGPMADAANTHMELFLVARSRDLSDRGFTIATTAAPPNRFSIHLPWATPTPTAYFDFPLDGDDPNGRMPVPFSRSPRHITLWHVFHGNSGGEVRVNGALVARHSPLTTPSRDFTQRLWVGGVVGGANQNVDIHELIVFDRALTESSRMAITRGLLLRWGLEDAAPLPEDGLHVHLDAMRPLATAELPVDGALPVWVDQGPGHRDAPSVGVRWEAEGLGTGLPSVRLRPGATDTNAVHIDVSRPSEPFTAFLVMATEDGRGTSMPMHCPSLLAVESQSTEADGGLLLCGGRPAFFRGNGAVATGATLSPYRIDDGRRHLLIVRREAGGATTVTVDRELVINANFGGAISSSQWLIGSHEGTDRNGSIQADLGELVVYDTALGDEALNAIERTLRAKWQTPIYSRAPFVSGCETGTRAVCPFTSIAAMRGASTGTHWLRYGRFPPFRVSVDASAGGGWILVLQYARQAGAPAPTRVVQPGFDWPVFDEARLGLAPQRASERWGHVGEDVTTLLTDATELRWYGTTSGHTRVIHFASGQGVDAWVAGRASGFSGLPMAFTPLGGHTALLPASASSFRGTGDMTLTEFPFFQPATAHWGIAAGAGNARWEVDDFPADARNATVHRVWVR